jgi:heat-inducible transcriptional repressor
MPEPTTAPELSAREREILKDTILMYILGAEPVSSRSLAKAGKLGLSAASIRNIMADLEERGYLAQPHTSAGRIPTRAGYHLFVEALMDAKTVPVKVRRYVEERLSDRPRDVDEMMEITSHLLSELSQQVGLVVAPAIGDTVLKAVELVPLASRPDSTRVLCVVVAESGFVDNKVVDTERPVPREELIWAGNYLTETFAGRTLREIRTELLRRMAEERAQVDQLMALAFDLASRGLDFTVPSSRDVLFDGTSTVLGQPELTDVGRVRRLLETFQDKARLVQLVTQVVEGDGVRVVIGEDSDLTSELDFSLVVAPYRVGERPLGTLGIFGPSRMEYQRVIPLVSYLGETLSALLTSESAGL